MSASVNGCVRQDEGSTHALKARQSWKTHPHNPVRGVSLEFRRLLGNRSQELSADSNTTNGDYVGYVIISSTSRYMRHRSAYQRQRRAAPMCSSHHRRRSGRCRSVPGSGTTLRGRIGSGRHSPGMLLTEPRGRRSPCRSRPRRFAGGYQW